jgi:hypothetical protein
MHVESEAFLKDDYQLKVGYLTDHMQRMWTRFNFFVTLQSGLVAGLIFTRDGGSFTSSALYFLIAEAVLACVWWIFGAQDRHLVHVYRNQIEEAWTLFAPRLDPQLPADYAYAGRTSKLNALDVHSPIDWRWEPISTTRLPALVPFGLLLFWLTMIGVYLAS